MSLSVFSQTPTAVIKGRIIGPDGQPAPNVSVQLKQLGKMARRDDQGIFQLQHLPALRDILLISSVESNAIKQAVSLQNGVCILKKTNQD